MGCNPSKSNGADAGTAVDVLEIGLELSDSDSRVLAANPLEVSREVVRESVSTVGAMFRETRPQLELMFPVALVGRCILNEMIDSTEPAYVGGIIEGLMLEDLSEVKEGAHVLRSKPLKTAAKQLMDLLQKVPERIAMEPGETLDTEMRALLKDAREVKSGADKAFKKVRTPSEKIRAVVIACAALEVERWEHWVIRRCEVIKSALVFADAGCSTDSLATLRVGEEVDVLAAQRNARGHVVSLVRCGERDGWVVSRKANGSQILSDPL